MADHDWVVWFDDPGACDVACVGGKGANLAILAQAGFPVPKGFCVTAASYRLAVAAGAIPRGALEDLEAAASRDAVAKAAERLRGSLLAAALPPAVEAAVLEAYHRLAPAQALVAVRSSATAEDLPEASFAGQQDTFLNLRGHQEVLDHLRRCWASVWTDRAVIYRRERGFDHRAVLSAVVIQEMVDPDTSGVMFTAHPVTGRRDHTVINASYGLGEAIVSGLVTPDTFVVEPESGRVVERRIGHKHVELVYGSGGGVAELPVDAKRAGRPALDDDQLARLADLGERIEEHFGAPQDVEWALAEGRPFVLQSRPITAIGDVPPAAATGRWTRGMFVEILPDAPCPLFCSMLELVLDHMLRFTFARMGMRPPPGERAVAVINSQPYFSLEFLRSALAPLPRASRERLAARIANPFSDHSGSQGAPGRPSVAEIRMAAHLVLAAHRLPRQYPRVIAEFYRQIDAAGADPGAMTDVEILAVIRHLGIDVVRPLVAYDFLLIVAFGFTERVLGAMVARSGLPDAEAVTSALMSGVTGNVTMETNKALWRLAEEARENPEVSSALTDTPAADVARSLESIPGAGEFRSAFDAFLARFGHREVRMDVAYPTWGEDPTPVVGYLAAYLEAEAPSPAAKELHKAEERRRSAAAVDAALGRRLLGRLVYRHVFRWANGAVGSLGADRDTMHFHWTAAFPVLRRLLSELGRRWAEAGHLEGPEDVYCITLADIDSFGEGLPGAAEIAKRRRRWQRDRQRRWPVDIRDGVAVAEKRAPLGAGAEVLKGVPASPGVAEGRVRVVAGPEEFGTLRRGEVLVAPLTNPVWTPLFALAGALVADAGGSLSHGAIVAREYGIPAVVGAAGATEALKDGQVVRVNGTRGEVEILAPTDP